MFCRGLVTENIYKQKKMAAETGDFKVVSICKLLLVFCIFTQISADHENQSCTENDIGTVFLPCNVTTRKSAIVYYLQKKW